MQSSTVRRVAAVLAIATGVFLVGFTFAEHMFTRADDAQTIADRYRSLMSTAGLRDLSSGFQAVQEAGGELGTRALPRLQQQMREGDAQFASYVSAAMPGIAAFDAQAPGVVKLVGPVIAKMRAARADYARADQIPTAFLPMSIAPWLFVGIGALLIGLGAFTWFRAGTAAAALVALAGLGLVVAPLVIEIPSKIDAAERVRAIGRIGLAPATAQRAVGATKLFDAMAADVTTKLEPSLGGPASFAVAFPTLASWAREWQSSTSAKSHALSDSQVTMGPVFASADQIPLEPIPWMFVAPGAVLAMLAGFTLLPARRRADAITPAATAEPVPAA